MKESSLLRYELRRLNLARPVCSVGSSWSAFSKALVVWQGRVDRKEKQLATATRRELRALARVLTYQADIYGPNGRIYSHEGKWTVVDLNREPTLYFRGAPVDASKLFDGHGSLIAPDSSL